MTQNRLRRISITQNEPIVSEQLQQPRTLTLLERCFYAAGFVAFLWFSIDHLFLYGQYYAHGGDQGVFDAFYLHVREAISGADKRYLEYWCTDKPNTDACKDLTRKVLP